MQFEVNSYPDRGYIGQSLLQPSNDSKFGIWLSTLNESCYNLTTSSTDSKPDDPDWDYSSALFLVMSMLTTIGITIYLNP